MIERKGQRLGSVLHDKEDEPGPEPSPEEPKPDAPKQAAKPDPAAGSKPDETAKKAVPAKKAATSSSKQKGDS